MATNYTIVVNPDAKAFFSFPKDTACYPFAISIQNTSPIIPTGNYNWFANNNFIGASTAFPGYSIIQPGDSVTIKLLTISAFGCKNDSVSHKFFTKLKPAPKFDLSRRIGCGPLQVAFTNRTPLIDTFFYKWDFGNGIVSNNKQPGTITFNSSPSFNDTTYIIKLYAFNECDTILYFDSIRVLSKPKAKFGVQTTFGCAPFTLVINNTSLGGQNTYFWDFGNGKKDTTFSNGTLNFTYYSGIKVDTFFVRLIAENQCGRDTQFIQIRVAPNTIRPQIAINAGELFGCIPHTVNFINSSSGATSFTWNFGDGTAPVVTNNIQFIVPHTYTTSGTFTVRIDLTNGCSDTSVTKTVTVFAKPIAAFNTNAVYCLGDTIRVTNNSQNASNYRWFWGDGQTTAGFAPVHLFSVPGTYNILLRAERTNPGGLVCYDTITQTVRVLIQPDVTVQTNIANVNCAPFTLNVSAPGIINETVTWYIMDTTVSPSVIIQNGVSAQYTFIKPGTFSIKMVAVNAFGCKDSTLKTFTVKGKPVANFTPLNIAVCKIDTTVSYLNTSTYNDFGPLTYKWKIDGIQQATTGNFTNRYVTPGTTILPKIFTTQLIASNAVGCSDTIQGLLRMNPNSKAQFSFNNPTSCVPFIATISNNSTYSSNYKWLLNGVPIDTTANPVITITQSATPYIITLITSNIYDCKPDTFSVNFTSRIKPKAAFKLKDTLGCNGFLNVVTTNQSTNANFYTWNWGDNTANSNFTSPTHLYNFTGQYLISLIASDGVCKDTTDKMVVIANKPVVDFSADNLISCGSAKVQFTNLTRNADTYLWSFSDGTNSTAVNPLKIFPASLLYYTVKLVAFNIDGCKDSLIKPNMIFAKIPPKADFVINPSPVISIPDYIFNFNNISLNSSKYKYQWSLGDGNFANTRDVTHKYQDTGTYTVRLIVLDTSSGCPDTLTKIARINGQPGYLYVPNAFYPNSARMEFKTFKPLGKGIAEYHLQIFDAWGKLLFETKDLDADGRPTVGWDGNNKGIPMAQDAYAWRIRAVFRSGKVWEGMIFNNRLEGQKGTTFGTVTLFR